MKTFELMSFEFGSSQPEGERKRLAIRRQDSSAYAAPELFAVRLHGDCVCIYLSLFAVHVHPDPSGGADSCHHPQQARLDVGG